MPEEMMPADAALSVGQLVHLYSAVPGEKSAARKGKIIELNTGFAAVAMDMTPEEYVTAPEEGAAFQCAVTGDNCVYRFATAFRSSAPLPDQLWYIQAPAEVERQQLRRFVRVPAPIPMRAKLMNTHGGFKNAVDTVMVDISGNGICFVSEKEALENTQVFVEVPNLPVIGTLSAQGVVRRCAGIDTPTGHVYHIGAYLGDQLSRSQQDKLIRSVFQLQRKHLERGMGI